ncbi:MAG: GNAT family N-acetyltransferase [Acidobacteria bacterium]|nr:GNAT family N-acetyltransferase [Acidobacteriota bacterium]
MTPPAIATRPATDADDAFLFALFKAVRAPDFAHLPLPPEQLEHLMSLQFAGQKHSYTAQYPGGHSLILLDGAPIGRIWLHRGAREHQLVDISLLPEYRNRGIGGALVAEAVAQARAAQVPLRCSVAVTNPGSLRFHQRLGFRIAARDEVYYDLAVEP